MEEEDRGHTRRDRWQGPQRDVCGKWMEGNQLHTRLLGEAYLKSHVWAGPEQGKVRSVVMGWPRVSRDKNTKIRTRTDACEVCSYILEMLSVS